MFDRAKQRLAERMNMAPKSQYSPDFDAGLCLFQNTAVGTEKVMVAMRNTATSFWHLPNHRSKGSTGKAKPSSQPHKPVWASEKLAETASDSAARLAHHPHAYYLLHLAKTQSAESTLQQTFARDVDLRVIMGLRDWLCTKDHGYRLARESMEGRRLEMDRAIFKARKVESPHDPRKIKAETKIREHMDAMMKVQVFVDGVVEDHKSHQRIMLEFLALQRRYHRNSEKNCEHSNAQLAIIATACATDTPPPSVQAAAPSVKSRPPA